MVIVWLPVEGELKKCVLTSYDDVLRIVKFNDEARDAHKNKLCYSAVRVIKEEQRQLAIDIVRRGDYKVIDL